MAGTREGLELRAEFSWNTEPLYLLKGDGTWAEANVPRQVVFGTELTTIDGSLRDPIAVNSIVWNASFLRLEITLESTVTPTQGDLVFNRLGIIRGGKQQGVYTGDFDSLGNTFTITSAIPEIWNPGDKIVNHATFDQYTVDSVSGTSGEILTLVEPVTTNVQDATISDASGSLMVVYVFSSDTAIFQNNSTVITIDGFSFAT